MTTKLDEAYGRFLVCSDDKWTNETYYHWYQESAKECLGKKYEDSIAEGRLIVDLKRRQIYDEKYKDTLEEYKKKFIAESDKGNPAVSETVSNVGSTPTSATKEDTGISVNGRPTGFDPVSESSTLSIPTTKEEEKANGQKEDGSVGSGVGEGKVA